MLESKFQADLIKEIKDLLPGCLVMKQDANYIQGIPDLIILYKDRWAMLECKKNKKSSLRPNQQYYIDRTNEMSFSRIIYPENKEEVLSELARSLESER